MKSKSMMRIEEERDELKRRIEQAPDYYEEMTVAVDERIELQRRIDQAKDYVHGGGDYVVVMLQILEGKL